MRYLDVKEEDFFRITTLDYTQERAVNLAGEDSNLIVRGTTDSGIKETIINIIANSLYKEKKVLVISKSFEYIKEIYKRLDYINEKTLLLNDDPKYFEEFNKDILGILDNLSNTTGKITLSKIKVLSREIDKKLKMLNSIYELFFTVRYSGLNLLDMYKISEKKLKDSDSIYKYYKIYRIKKPFLNYKYLELNTSVEKLLNENNIEKYVKYRRFKTNKLFYKLINDISENNIKLSLKNINFLLSNQKYLDSPLINSNYTEDFINAFLENNIISIEDINLLSKEVNLNHNGSILDNDYRKNKWSPFYWIKYKTIMDIKSSKKSKFANFEKDIYSEFIDNLENLNIYIKEFDFIKDIVNVDEYKNFIKKLIRGEGIVEYLKKLRNTLNIYENFKNINLDIENFNEIEINILNYSYNNLEKKEEIRSLISYIPNFYLLHNIEEIETSEKEILYYYKNFEIILKDIQLSMNTKISLIPVGIKYIWENKVLNLLKQMKIDLPSIVNYMKNTEIKLKLKEFLSSFKEVIFNIYPCVLINYKDINDILPNIEGLFDVVIFCDRETIFEKDVQSIVYSENTNIIIDEHSDILKGPVTPIQSKDFLVTELEYNYNNLNILYKDDISINSYIQKELYETLTRIGYKLKVNANICGYDINLIVYDNKYNKPILAIECDDMLYDKSYNSRKVDVCRRNYLEENGFNFIRIWSRDWWLNKKSEIKRIESILEVLLLEK